MSPQQFKNIIEAALFAANQPLSISQLQKLFSGDEMPESEGVKAVLEELASDWSTRGIELRQVSSGYRFQVRIDLAPWISRLSEERPARYSRALLETLALVVYRQPITRAGIEDVRGVSVSTSIMKTLIEREWVRIVGHRDVPGKPALYGTTRKFLDDFNLKSLSELPPLSEIKPIDHMQEELELRIAEEGLVIEAGNSPASDDSAQENELIHNLDSPAILSESGKDSDQTEEHKLEGAVVAEALH